MKIEKLPWEFLTDVTEEVNAVGTKVNELVDAFNRQSEKEQASEDHCIHLRLGFCLPCLKDYLAKPQENGSSFSNSTTPGFQAKPQEEPKAKTECKCQHCGKWFPVRADSPLVEPIDHDCHKESESKPPTMDEQIAEAVSKEKYIVLEKPKGMSIGEALEKFMHETEYQFWTVSDDDFLKLWQEWLNTFPLSDRKSTDNNVGNCGIKNCKLSSVHAHVLYL